MTDTGNYSTRALNGLFTVQVIQSFMKRHRKSEVVSTNNTCDIEISELEPP